MTPADSDRMSQFKALASALRGEPVEEVRCPNCGVRPLDETRTGVWDCRRCGRVENPRTDADANCPYCGRRPLSLYWEEAIVECESCGVVDKADLWALHDG